MNLINSFKERCDVNLAVITFFTFSFVQKTKMVYFIVVLTHVSSFGPGHPSISVILAKYILVEEIPFFGGVGPKNFESTIEKQCLIQIMQCQI